MNIKELFKKPKPEKSPWKFMAADKIPPEHQLQFRRLLHCHLKAGYTPGDAKRLSASAIANGKYTNAFPF